MNTQNGNGTGKKPHGGRRSITTINQHHFNTAQNATRAFTRLSWNLLTSQDELYGEALSWLPEAVARSPNPATQYWFIWNQLRNYTRAHTFNLTGRSSKPMLIGFPNIAEMCPCGDEDIFLQTITINQWHRSLDPRSALVIDLRLNGKTGVDIARRLGLTPARISQITRDAWRLYVSE